MPKRAVPTSARSPRPKRSLALVSPHASSTSCIPPITNGIRAQALFPTPPPQKSSILDNRIDASIYSQAQLLWFQSHDTQSFKTCFDFVRCDNEILVTLFPSKFDSNNRIPLSHRHTAVSIRQFQEFGNKQQLHLFEQETTCPPPFISERKVYTCLGIRIQYLIQAVVNTARRQNILNGYGHLICEAIRSRADNICDGLYPEYYTGVVKGKRTTNLKGDIY